MNDVTADPEEAAWATARTLAEALPFFRDAVAVRRWDDRAKDTVVTPPRFAHFAPLLAALVRT